jgi:hypothetical protein
VPPPQQPSQMMPVNLSCWNNRSAGQEGSRYQLFGTRSKMCELRVRALLGNSGNSLLLAEDDLGSIG